jgi:inhibitor of cysteine peptidase
VLLTDQDDNKIVTARAGDTIEVSLGENPSTGYRWEITEFDSRIVSVERNEFAGSAGGAGAGGTRRVAFRARAAGTVHIELALRRTWEPADATLARWSIAIEVQAGPAGQE